MPPIELKDPARFAEAFLRLSLMQGFGSLNKRDLELLTFVLLERDGAISRGSSNAAVALQLRITPRGSGACAATAMRAGGRWCRSNPMPPCSGSWPRC